MLPGASEILNTDVRVGCGTLPDPDAVGGSGPRWHPRARPVHHEEIVEHVSRSESGRRLPHATAASDLPRECPPPTVWLPSSWPARDGAPVRRRAGRHPGRRNGYRRSWRDALERRRPSTSRSETAVGAGERQSRHRWEAAAGHKAGTLTVRTRRTRLPAPPLGIPRSRNAREHWVDEGSGGYDQLRMLAPQEMCVAQRAVSATRSARGAGTSSRPRRVGFW